MDKIDAWRKAIEQGKKGNRAGTACLLCSKKKVACDLPATAMLKASVKATPRPKRQASPVPSSVSSGKRRRLEVVGETKGRAPPEDREASVALMRQMVGVMRESVVLLRSIEGIWKGMTARQEGPREESSAMAARRAEEEAKQDDSTDEEDGPEVKESVKGGKGKEKA